jgi:gentisate 1,2-dioxygenase
MAAAIPDPRKSAASTDYTQRVASQRLVPLWNFFNDWFTPLPKVAAEPYLWHYDSLRSSILESVDVISAKDAERRVLVLENPGLVGKHLITDTLYAGLQVITPGEIAPAHRHSPVALRFVIEGQGGYTAVAGERTWMEPGDFVITPSWAWHDHGHEGTGPFVWMDVLDVPLVRFLGANFTEHYPEERYPEDTPVNDSLHRFGANMRPVGYSRSRLASPIFSYPYARTREALERLKAHSDWDPCHGLKMEYIDPTTGGPAIPTISTFIQLVPGGFSTQACRSTDGAVYAVVEGRGTVTIGEGERERTFVYGPRDIFAVPCWDRFAIDARDESVFFSASDRIVQTKLGIWRESR